MKTGLMIGGGALLLVLGVLWTLQGLDVVGGSAMSGKTVFAVVGPIVALIGVGLGLVGMRGRSSVT